MQKLLNFEHFHHYKFNKKIKYENIKKIGNAIFASIWKALCEYGCIKPIYTFEAMA